jgi:hypothetical protein
MNLLKDFIFKKYGGFEMSSKRSLLRRMAAVAAAVAFLSAPSTNAIQPEVYDGEDAYETEAFKQPVLTKFNGRFVSYKGKVPFHRLG